MANRLTEGAWTWPEHLNLLSQELVDAACGRCPRLFVTMPPQNGKSSLTAHWFPVWYLDRRPDHRIVFISYAADYAHQWGRAVRNSIEEHAATLRVKLAPDSAAADDWSTTAGGGMVSVGVGGAVTGRRANVLIVDDPFKNAEEANSPAHRQKVWDFFQSAAYTRLTPDGIIIIVMTRWHEDDLVGRLKTAATKGDGEAWEQVNLPAVAHENDPMGRKPGDALWPARWPLEALKRIKKAVGSYWWSALYDQDPKTPEGSYYKRSWFRIIEPDRVPRLAKVTRCWDLAATAADEGNDPDWLAGAKTGKGEDGRYYILHVHREQTTPEGVEKAIKQYAMIDGRSVAIRIEQEGAASGKIVKHHYERMMDGWDCRFTGIPRSSKLTRSGPFNAAAERGDVVLVQGDWNQDFLDEVAAFPNGRHDDQQDAAVGSYTDLVDEADSMTPEDWKNVLSYDPPGKKKPYSQMFGNR